MIHLDITIAHPNMSAAEEERWREHIRSKLQPELARIAASFLINDEIGFVKSQKLTIDGTIKVVEGEAPTEGRHDRFKG